MRLVRCSAAPRHVQCSLLRSPGLTFPQPSHRHHHQQREAVLDPDLCHGSQRAQVEAFFENSENFREVSLTALPRMQGRVGCTDLITDWDE